MQFKLKLNLLDIKDGINCEDAERKWHRLALMYADVVEVRNENCGSCIVLKSG